MKKLIMIACIFLLSACSEGVTSQRLPALPPELQDCKAYYVTGGLTGFTGYVLRCPNSSTTIQYGGKSKTHVTVVDGEPEEPTPRENALSKLTEEDKKTLGL